MSDTFESIPNDIANFPGGTKADLWTDIGENFDACENNDTWTQDQLELLIYEAVGPKLLTGTPETFLTGEGTGTFTAEQGIRACVPVGAVGSQTNAALVETAGDLTQGQAGDGANYAYLVRNPTTGVVSLSVTLSATAPPNALALGSATVTAGVIGTITQESLPA